MDDLRTKFGAMSHEERKVASREREIRGDQVLMQRNSHYKSANWSLVAGFVDPGENLEEAVHRPRTARRLVSGADLRQRRRDPAVRLPRQPQPRNTFPPRRP